MAYKPDPYEFDHELELLYFAGEDGDQERYRSLKLKITVEVVGAVSDEIEDDAIGEAVEDELCGFEFLEL